jgi:hypothetical protein
MFRSDVALIADHIALIIGVVASVGAVGVLAGCTRGRARTLRCVVRGSGSTVSPLGCNRRLLLTILARCGSGLLVGGIRPWQRRSGD